MNKFFALLFCSLLFLSGCCCGSSCKTGTNEGCRPGGPCQEKHETTTSSTSSTTP